jgi:hypothetical protein
VALRSLPRRLVVILTAADRAVDRQRALIRAARAAEIMQGLPFNDNVDSILAYCVATMQNVPPEEAKAVEAKISLLQNDSKNAKIHDTIKSYILGLQLLTLVGDRVLTRAVRQLKDVLVKEAGLDAGHGAEPQAESAGPNGKSDMMLQVLWQAGGVMLLDELRKQVGLELDESYLIDDLQRRGLAKLQRDEAGNETVHITTNTN